MNEQELNKKLAEWAGFTPAHPNCGNPKHMTEPKGTLYGGCVPIPDFTQSLDACFKWLIPKVQTKVGDRKLVGLVNGAVCYAVDHKMATALALCLAIEKLIDKEE